MKLGVTAHAVQRYVERVKPALDVDAARRELLALIAAAEEPTPEQPDWLDGQRYKADAWLEIADGIVLCIVGSDITTLMTRGGTNPERRAAKTAHKKRKRAERRWRAQRRTLPYAEERR